MSLIVKPRISKDEYYLDIAEAVSRETFGVTRKKDSIREKCTKSLGLKGMPSLARYF